MELKHQIVSNPTEFDSFVKAVKETRLPYLDLNFENQVLINYYVGKDFVGTGGLEIVNKFGLLRSVSVAPKYRHQGLGQKITHDLVNLARKGHLSSLYLLTETAKAHFNRLGFKEIDRELVPIEISATQEFASVCPASATCMWMRLDQAIL